MVIAAVVGVVGAVVTGVAGTVVSAKQGDAARKDARAAAEKQEEAADAQLAFQKEQYEDWESVYGPVKENLASFYQELTPETFTASGLAQINEQYEATHNQFERQFAQRNIDSAAQDMMQQQASLGAGQAKAELRHGAPLQLASAEQGFLSNSVVNRAAPGVANAYGSQMDVYGNQEAAARDREAQANSNMWGSIAGIGSSISSGVTSYLGMGGGMPSMQGSNVANVGLSNAQPSMAFGSTSNQAILNALY